MLDWIISEKNHNDEPVYSLDDAKKRYETISLPGGYLILNWAEDGLWLKFAVLEFYSSNIDDTNTLLSIEFYGEGPSSGLRECRHTYWGRGDAGYVFCPNGKLISAALLELSKYFDDLI